MKKSLIAAAALAAVAFGVAGPVDAASVGTGLGGVSAQTGGQSVEHVYWRRHHRQWVCRWHHHHKHCWWRYY